MNGLQLCGHSQPPHREKGSSHSVGINAVRPNSSGYRNVFVPQIVVLDFKLLYARAEEYM
jgi:hypothetical protein